MHLTTLQIIGIVFLVLIFGGLIWRIAKRLVGFLIIAVLVLVGIYFVKPTLLDEWFGHANVQKVEQVVKQGADSVKTHTNKLSDKIGDAVDSVAHN